MNKSTIVCFTYLLLWKVDCSEKGNNTFVPSKDWQTVKDGQPIPQGLHVRINLKTGKKEAKLLDDDDEAKKDLAVVRDADNDSVEKPNTANDKTPSEISKELEEALKKIPGNTYEYSDEKMKELNKKFKSYDELKQSFEDMNMSIKTDSEIITNLIAEYKNHSKGLVSEARFAAILEDLNYLVHQIDNSLWFIQEGGLDLILLPIIVNHTDLNLRTKSLRILGALAQNNPKAQINVYERNFGYYLSQILITSSNSEELSTCLYAFGSLLRKFPHAQKQVLSKYGTKALISVLNRESELKIKIKAMTFINDLLVEKDYAVEMQSDQSNYEKVKQHQEVYIEEWLKENKFCDAVVDFTVKSQNQLVVNTDLADYLVQSLQTTQRVCFDVWSENALLKNTLSSIKERFEGTEEEYLVEIAQKFEKLNNVLFAHSSKKDEL